MEQWRKLWREGIGPQISRSGLRALRNGLLCDDPALIQRAATFPPPIDVMAEEPIEGACAMCYCAWRGDGLGTVGEASAYYEEACAIADNALGEPGAVRHFLNWFDEIPRVEMRRLLLAEVNRMLNLEQPARRSFGADIITPAA